MELKDIIKKKDVSVADLQEFQRIYDKRFVDQKFHGSDEKIRHTALHLMKTVAKVARYAERREHGKECSTEELANEVVPDLLVYASWLAGETNSDLSNTYFKRMVYNIERFYADKCSEGELDNLRELVSGL